MKQTEERHSESRMREIRLSGSMRGSDGRRCRSVVPYSTESSWENALKHIPKGCRKVSCDGVDAGHTRCKDGECDMVVFLALSKANTPHYHAMGRKIGTQFGWSSTIFHYTRRTSDNQAVKGLTPIDAIIDPQAHVEEYFPALLDKTRKREKFCFCCKCRDDKVQ